LNSEHQQTPDEVRRQESLISEKQAEIDHLQQQLASQKSQLEGQLSASQAELDEEKKRSTELQQQHSAKYAELETRFTRVLAEKTELESELDGMRIRIQTSQTALDEKANDTSDAVKRAEETIQELQVCFIPSQESKASFIRTPAIGSLNGDRSSQCVLADD
jgi:chromosome segregation ATPase